MALSTGATQPHGILSKSELLKRVGVKEPLLCQGCEKKLSGWENYARMFLYGNKPGKITKIEVGLVDTVNPNPVVQGARRMQANYAPFKLFLLSLLWRASVSKNPFFQPVHIGKDERRLRRMLLDADPGGQFDFPCMLTDLRLAESTMMDFIERPSSGYLDGTEIVRFIMGGYVWWFMYHGAPRSPLHKETFMDEDGKFLVLIDDSGRIPKEFYDSLNQAGRLPLIPFDEVLAKKQGKQRP